jgi:S-adenosylmethionine:tRNA ribosyltransferase-isomerase
MSFKKPMSTRTSDYSFELPEALIAQHPLEQRDASRLLHLDRSCSAVSHTTFSALSTLLRPGDRLVFNDTKVLPARLFCTKVDTAVPIELLFTHRRDGLHWDCIAKPARRLKVDALLAVNGCEGIFLKVLQIHPGGERTLTLCENPSIESIDMLLERCGVMPLPPYITRSATQSDHQRYQTVYASAPGAIAAPTAGLHFSQQLLQQLQQSGIQSSFLTLHVGIGTFRPVASEDVSQHQMHTEYYTLSEQTVAQIEQTRRSGGRIIAVGTTSVRTLESCCRSGTLEPGEGGTELFILPGFKFGVVDGIITNFHLPQSTLLMLVSAFAGREAVLNAYREAVEQRYRFFSYGDAMAIL